MNRGKIIVVEGPSNSGKTTTCQNMKNYADCIVIDECMIYEKNPPRPSQIYEQEIQNQLFFFEVERRRMKKATTLALEGKNVILDRCALSTVAIIYAFEKLGKTREAKSRFYRLIDYGEQHLNDEGKIEYFAVSLPDFLIFDEDYTKKNPQALVPLQQASHGSVLPTDPTGGKIYDALKVAADKVEIEGVSAKDALDEAQKTAEEAMSSVSK